MTMCTKICDLTFADSYWNLILGFRNLCQIKTNLIFYWKKHLPWNQIWFDKYWCCTYKLCKYKEMSMKLLMTEPSRLRFQMMNLHNLMQLKIFWINDYLSFLDVKTDVSHRNKLTSTTYSKSWGTASIISSTFWWALFSEILKEF